MRQGDAEKGGAAAIRGLDEFTAQGSISEQKRERGGNSDAGSSYRETEDRKTQIPDLGKVHCGKIVEQQNGQWNEKDEFVHPGSESFADPPQFAEEQSQKHHEKDGDRRIQAEYQIFHITYPFHDKGAALSGRKRTAPYDCFPLLTDYSCVCSEGMASRRIPLFRDL